MNKTGRFRWVICGLLFALVALSYIDRLIIGMLKKPIGERYKGEIRDLVDALSALEKLKLYDRLETPDRLALHQAKELRSHVSDLWHESDLYPRYEGGQGASAREIKTALFNAATKAG